MLDTTGGGLPRQRAGDGPALSGWLRARTRVEHAAVEARLDLDRPLGADEAVHVLQGWSAVWQDVRAAAAAEGASAVAVQELVPMAEQALAWLADDLGAPALRARPEVDGALPCLTALLADPAAAWGVAYVLRGARLGGAVLAPRVDAALVPLTGRPSAFLASPGVEPGREWVAFRRRLDDCGVPAAAALTAARWTFCWVAAALAPAGARPQPVGAR